MKIRYYQKLDAGRWIGFLIAMTGCFVLSNADVDTQWMGWAIACISCSMWIRFAIKDNGQDESANKATFYIIPHY